MYEINDIVYQKANVEGWLTDREGKLLYILAKEATDRIVEIGSWKGRSTIFLALGSMDGNSVPVYAIDRFTGSSEHRATMGKVDTYDDFCANIHAAGVDSIVCPMKGDSNTFVNKFEDNSLDLLFIDGSHEFAYAVEDFELYYPKMKKDGVVAFHDWGTNGPTQAVVLNLNKFGERGVVDGMIACRIK